MKKKRIGDSVGWVHKKEWPVPVVHALSINKYIHFNVGNGKIKP